MSTFDDFSNYRADQARVKFARAQYESVTVDEWVALVNRLDGVVESVSEDAARYRDLCD